MTSLDTKQNGESAGAIKENTGSGSKPRTTKRSIFAAVIMLTISYMFLPDDLQPSKPTVEHVFFYGWISALSTGLGVLPLIFTPELDSYWIGVSNGKNCSRYHLKIGKIFYLRISMLVAVE